MTNALLKTITTCTTNWPVNLVSFLFCVSSIFYSCKDPKKVSLQRQVLDNPSGIVFVDTFDVKVETVRIDTPSTKNIPHLFVGNYKDALLGDISLSTYSELSYSGFDSLSIDVIDSVVLKINYDMILGTTTGQVLSFDLKELTEKVDSATKYNSTSSLALGETITSVSFAHNKYTFSQNNLALISHFKKAIKKPEKEFKSLIKGLALVPTSSNSSFAIGINTSNTNGFAILIYGHKGTEATSNLYQLSMSTKSQRFVKGTYSNSELPMSTFAKKSSEMENKAVLNDLFGIRSRISFPSLTNFLHSIKNEYTLLETSIYVPSADNFKQTVDFPLPYIYLIECDTEGNPLKNSNGTYKQVQNEISGKNTPGDLRGTVNPYFSYYDNQNTRFKYPFSLYAQEIQKGVEIKPFIVSLYSYYAKSTVTPLSYSYFDKALDGIKIVVYYSKSTL